MEISKIVGENLARLRTERNLSLGQLAERAGISKVMLSQIEKGEANPSINTIWKIAAGLKVSYTALLEQYQPGGVVIRRRELTPQPLEGGQGQLLCYFQSSSTRSFELFDMELAPGCRYASPGHGERTAEYLVVTAGTLTLTIGGETHTLAVGDAVHFPASGSHVYANSGTQPLHMLVINDYGC